MTTEVPNSALNAMLLGEDKAITAAGVFVLLNRSKDLPASHDNCKKYFISGAIITDADLPVGEDWHMMECEVVIIPKKIYRRFNDGSAMRMGQIIVSGYADANNWREEVKF